MNPQGISPYQERPKAKRRSDNNSGTQAHTSDQDQQMGPMSHTPGIS